MASIQDQSLHDYPSYNGSYSHARKTIRDYLAEYPTLRLVLEPHLGGITEAAFCRCHLHMWRNAERVADGHKPDNIVNGLE